MRLLVAHLIPTCLAGFRYLSFPFQDNQSKKLALSQSTLLLLSTERPMRIENMSCANITFMSSSGTTDSSGAVVVCPKTSSTSAGVLLYDIPDGHGKSELQTTAMCLLFETKNRPASDVKEIAKFKQTDDDRTNAQLMCGACVRSRSHAFAHSICGWRLPRSQWP